MEVVEIRNKFHDLIEHIHDTHILQKFYQAMNFYRIKRYEDDILDDLSDSQQARLKESIRQGDEGKTIDHQQMKTEIKEWLTG
jgi:hypothetical protein